MKVVVEKMRDNKTINTGNNKIAIVRFSPTIITLIVSELKSQIKT